MTALERRIGAAPAQVIRWEEPPPPQRAPAPRLVSKYEGVAAQLRARPRQWAVIAQGVPTGSASGLAFRVRGGNGAFAPKGAYEAKFTGTKGGTDAAVYARFVG